MVLNGVFIGMVGIRTDQQNYFNIPEPTQAELTASQYRTSGTNINRNRFSQRLDSTVPGATAVVVNRTGKTRNHSKDNPMRGGRAIKIPTELTSTPPRIGSTDPNNTVIPKPTIRFTTIKFPGTADLAEISAWLHLKLTAKKPKYMKAPGGRSYPLVPFTGTVTGASTTTP
jgi:hypothetical protein